MLSPHVQAHMGMKNSKSMHLNCRVGSHSRPNAEKQQLFVAIYIDL